MKHVVKHERVGLSRKEKKTLEASYQKHIAAREPVTDEVASDVLPIASKIPALGGFWSSPVRRPYHRATGFQLAAANPFAAADVFDAAGPVIGVEMLSGGRLFTFDPWELYHRQLVMSPNLLIQGAIGQGKSHLLKRLVSLLVLFGRQAINISDSKGEHGDLALAIGGDVFKMGAHGSKIRLNPLQAPERWRGETEQEWHSRVKSARISVLQQLAGLLVPAGKVDSREATLLDLAVDEAARETTGEPTLQRVWEALGSAEVLGAYGGTYFHTHDADALRDGFRRLVHGDLAGMYDTHSTVSLDAASPYTVFDTSAISIQGQALPVTQVVTNAWAHAAISNKSAGRRYFLIREEGWRDMKTVAALEAHQEQLKLSREYGIAMVLVVHEDGDFDSVGPEGSKERELARGLLNGYANRLCFKQDQKTLLSAVASGTFSEAEAVAISSLAAGQFLVKLSSGSYVVDGTATTTAWERSLFDTDKQLRGEAA